MTAAPVDAPCVGSVGKRSSNVKRKKLYEFTIARSDGDARLVLLLLAGGAAGGIVGIFVSRLLSSRITLARSLFAAMILLVALYVGVQATGALLAG